MNKRWPKVRLGKVLKSIERGEAPMPGKTYRQIGVKLWGEGCYEREPIDGADTRYNLLFRAEAGDIIVNKIWARNGSVAVVTEELAGCYGSAEFPMFEVVEQQLESRWMHWIQRHLIFGANVMKNLRVQAARTVFGRSAFSKLKSPSHLWPSNGESWQRSTNSPPKSPRPAASARNPPRRPRRW